MTILDRVVPSTMLRGISLGRDNRDHAPTALSPNLSGLRVHRLCTVLAAMSLFAPAISASTPIIQLPLVGLISILGFLAILALVLMALLCRTEEALGRVDRAILPLALVLLGIWAASQLYFDPVYGTDEAAFVQYAAQLLQHGHNPYAANMLPSLTQFQVPIQYATYLLNGGISSTFAYPSLAFLLVVPFAAVTHGVQAVIVANVFFLAIELVVMFYVLPRQVRALAPVVVLGLPILFGYTVGGVIDTLFVPFLLIVAYRWTDIGRGGRLGSSGLARAVCLGMACSISQFPWFVAPFIILGIWRLRAPELGNRRVALLAARFVGVAAGAALVVNAPFIVWGPGAWLKGVTTPLLQHAVPFGQGIVAASVFFRVGGGDLSYYTYAAVALFVGLLVVYWVWFRRLWRAAFVLPSVILLFPARSLTEYVVTVMAVWIVSLVVPGRGPTVPSQLITAPDLTMRSRFFAKFDGLTAKFGDRRWVRWLMLAVFLPTAGFLTLALATPAPLTLRVLSVTTNGQFERVWQIQVAVTNRSSSAVDPHFTAHSTSQLTPFWEVRHGPAKLRSGQTASYTLVAPDVGSMPFITQPFVVQAVTAQPESISSSSAYTPEQYDCYITPSYVNKAVPLGGTVLLRIQLRSPFGAQVHQRGVPVALGQVIYAQTALVPAEAQINGAPEGQTPVTTRTDASGVATFRVRDATVQGNNPVYFQAYVDPTAGFPHGYSEVVSILWGPKPG